LVSACPLIHADARDEKFHRAFLDLSRLRIDRERAHRGDDAKLINGQAVPVPLKSRFDQLVRLELSNA
jgi:hypothetical protein